MDIEQRALELVKQHGGCYGPALEAAIEAGDAERAAFDAFRLEVSDSLTAYFGDQTKDVAHGHLGRFIIQPKTDPLVEVFDECFHRDVAEGETWSEAMARKTRAALKSRGLEIREVV